MRKLIIILIIQFTSVITFACDCDSIGGFKEIIPHSDEIVIVKIESFIHYKKMDMDSVPLAMKVSVINRIKGSDMSDTLLVWGDNGYSCRPYLNKFKSGEYYLMGLRKLKTNDENTYYELSNCGEFYLPADIEKQIVHGRIEGLREYRDASFDEIIALVKKQ